MQLMKWLLRKLQNKTDLKNDAHKVECLEAMSVQQNVLLVFETYCRVLCYVCSIMYELFAKCKNGSGHGLTFRTKMLSCVHHYPRWLYLCLWQVVFT